jgi:type II secretory pathway component HofQ
LTTGIFGTAQIDLAITAGERKGQAKIIASPRVTVLNNQEATIQSGTKIPIQTIQPGQTGGTPIVTTEYVDVPLKLTITPQITDVGTVVLQVLAENASTAISAPGVPPAINNQKMDTQVTSSTTNGKIRTARRVFRRSRSSATCSAGRACSVTRTRSCSSSRRASKSRTSEPRPARPA